MTTKKTQAGTAPLADWLPTWVSSETWIAFREHRTKMKAPMTNKVELLMLGKLDESRRKGHNPNSLLENAMLQGWKFPYEPKANAADVARVTVPSVARKSGYIDELSTHMRAVEAERLARKATASARVEKPEGYA